MSDPNVMAAIDAMVAAQINSNPATANNTVASSGESASYNTASDQLTILSASPGGRIYDNGVDLDAGAVQLQAQADRYQAQLDEVRFNTQTGKPEPVLTGRDREIVQRSLEQHVQTAKLQLEQWSALRDQRAADVRASEERNARSVVTGGDPAKEALLNAEIEKLRIADAARTLYERSKQGK